MDQLLKPSEVVRYLGTSRSWVYDAAKRGDIPSIRLGTPDGPLRFIQADLEEWLNDARNRWQPGRPAVANHRDTRARERTGNAAARSNVDTPARQLKFEL
jgi:excisionase family DNA binding protein